jgi:peptidoglycan/LPS O-acetylase OafA/YrhL
MTTAASNDRMFGLDVCRTIAVLLVVSWHMLHFSSPHPFLASWGLIGLFGVDLFFSLSGFLIGRILLQQSTRWPEEKVVGLTRFWYRRWMRTLPLYFFYFLVSLKYDLTGATTVSARLSYLIFAQNLIWPMPDFYGMTWSLAVEEWFYFLFPLLILTLIGFGKAPRQAVAITIASFVLIPPLLRFIFRGYFDDFGSIDKSIRYVTVIRLDSIGFGVLVAYISQWHGALFQRLIKLWWLFLILILMCIISTTQNYFTLSQARLVAPVYFSISAFAFAGLIPFFSNLKLSQSKFLNRFVKFTSLISYSMYLGHIFAFVIGMTVLRKLGIFDTIYPNPWLVYPVFYALVYLLSSTTYWAIERPILALRDRNRRVAEKSFAQICKSTEL